METKDFMRGLIRYCRAHKRCEGCLLAGKCTSRSLYQGILYSQEPDVAEIIEGIEDWIKQNPEKTRQDVFLERYPGAEINPDNGALAVPPCYVDANKRRATRNHMCGVSCTDCQKDYWSQPADDDDKN